MRVVIGDDSGLFRQLLGELLDRHGFDVAGFAADADAVLAVTADTQPDVVILDIRMPPTHRDEGLHVAASIRTAHPGTGVLLLSHYAETAYAVRLLENADGGVGYLIKDRVQDTDRLIEAVRRVGAGEVVVDPDLVRRVLARPRLEHPLMLLSAPEHEVLALVAEGWSNAAIARRLRYSPKTVEKRITAISQKLGLPEPGTDDRADVNVRVLAVLTYLR